MKKLIYSLFGPYLHVQNVRKNKMIGKAQKQIICFVVWRKKINNSDEKTYPLLDIKWLTPKYFYIKNIFILYYIQKLQFLKFGKISKAKLTCRSLVHIDVYKF